MDKKITIALPQILEFRLTKKQIKSTFAELDEKGFEKAIIDEIIKETDDYVCLGCGCTDTFGCECGCYWLGVDPNSGFGVCSNCGEHMKNISVKEAS